MAIHYKYNRNEEIISHLLKCFPEFKKIYSVPITFSDEIPPIFQKGREFGGKEKEVELTNYPIDELMGAYYPETRNIVIYLQGINRAAKDLASRIKLPSLYENLIKIVILHELGHYWFHNVKFSPVAPTEWFDEPQVNEWIAQMFVSQCVKEDEILKQTVLKLSESQSKIYQSFWCTREMINDHFKEIVQEIRKTALIDRTYDKLKKNEKIKFHIDVCKYNI